MERGCLGVSDMTSDSCAAWYAEHGNTTSDTQAIKQDFGVSYDHGGQHDND